jgi:hypothetical protein
MPSCRQSIEWNYGDLKYKWSFINQNKNLQLSNQLVISTVICVMLFINAHVTLNGNITSDYFNYLPPTLANWTKDGPRFINLSQVLLGYGDF